MNITSAIFIKGVVADDPILNDGIPQIAFIGRSNVGKSSVINAFVNQKGLAITSSFPGRTQQINFFLINKSFYLVDLPGYGFAKVSGERRGEIEDLINWYFFESNCEQRKVVLIIDAKVGPTKDDLQMLHSLEDQQKSIIVVANKVDKIKKLQYDDQISKIKTIIGDHKIVPFSAEKRFGVNELVNAISH
ncbi:MAG: ribosome biogenesis GTP-binding protein YihA/YsxC [Candidatus Magasanikbacteria bacterium]|jgi:GTP-binding protein